jgi:hypothetical protein
MLGKLGSLFWMPFFEGWGNSLSGIRNTLKLEQLFF